MLKVLFEAQKRVFNIPKTPKNLFDSNDNGSNNSLFTIPKYNLNPHILDVRTPVKRFDSERHG